MKLKEFNCENSPSRKTSPSISINSKSGVFTFNPAAMSLIGLSGGDKVVLHKDEQDAANWYVEKLSHKESGRGFSLRVKDDSYGATFCSTNLAREFFKVIGYLGTSGKALIAGRVTEYRKRKLYGILTNSLKATQRTNR